MIVLPLTREQRLSRSLGCYAVFNDDPVDPTFVDSFESEQRAKTVATNLNDRPGMVGRHVVAVRVGDNWVWGAGAEYQRGMRRVFGAGAPTGQSRFFYHQGRVRVA